MFPTKIPISKTKQKIFHSHKKLKNKKLKKEKKIHETSDRDFKPYIAIEACRNNIIPQLTFSSFQSNVFFSSPHNEFLAAAPFFSKKNIYIFPEVSWKLIVAIKLLLWKHIAYMPFYAILRYQNISLYIALWLMETIICHSGNKSKLYCLSSVLIQKDSLLCFWGRKMDFRDEEI